MLLGYILLSGDAERTASRLRYEGTSLLDSNMIEPLGVSEMWFLPDLNPASLL